MRITKPKCAIFKELLVIITIAIAVLLRILNLGSRELWYDEVLSLLFSTGQKVAYHTPEDSPVVLGEYTSLLRIPAELAGRDVITTVRELLRGLLGGEPHPPLFFLSQHLWLRFFGNSDMAMRSLSALLSVGAIGSAYGLGRVLLGHRGGLFLTALLGINPFYLFHSLNVRMYGPLVLWTTLSAWALLHLVNHRDNQAVKSRHTQMLWNSLLIGSVAAGLLTFYLFAYWVVTLAALVLYLDRQRWWQYGRSLGTGVLLIIPWVLWGTLKQLHNADLKRFGASKEVGAVGLRHLEDVAQTLGTHLLLGDWVTSLTRTSTLIAGFVVIVLLLACTFSLWSQGEHRALGVALLMGIFPLLLALGVDIATGNFTLFFGWGRTTIFILPGCLLLLALWVERAPWRWRELVAVGLLLLYLSICIGDFSLRHRWVFHPIADLIAREPATPTLIAMNSKAWGHVLRLAYYIPPTASVMLLAQEPANLASSLAKVLLDDSQYPRILWLDSANTVWSRLQTETEIEMEKRRIQQVLSAQFQLTLTQQLSGTMDLDQFTIKLYTRSRA